jgi:signal transduction histidine kinase
VKSKIHILILAILSLGLGFIYFKTYKLNLEEVSNSLKIIRQIKHIDTAINENILLLQTGLVQNFDEITTLVKDQELLIDGFLKAAKTSEIQHKEEFHHDDHDNDSKNLNELFELSADLFFHFKEAHENKKNKIEEFKKTYSVYRNSVIYLPEAYQNIINKLNDKAEYPELYVALADVFPEVSLYLVTNDKDLFDHTKYELENIEYLSKDIKDENLKFLLNVFLVNSSNSLDGSHKINLFIKEIIEEKTRENVLNIYDVTDKIILKVEGSQRFYNLAFLVNSLMLILYIIYFIFSLYKSSSRLTESNKLLEIEKLKSDEANRLKTEFLLNISHELRTPMHAILSYSALGIEKFDKTPKDKLIAHFENINKSGKRLLRLINDLLDISKLETGRSKLSFQNIKIASVIDDAVNELAAVFESKNLTVRKTYVNDNISADIDPRKMHEVLINLFSNAAKFSNQSEEILVEVTNDVIDSKNSLVEGVKIRIKDNGVGIPDEELDIVFDKFIQSTKTKTGAGGTGLGLSICRGIINAHGGKIWAENNASGGSSFIVVIPLKQSV